MNETLDWPRIRHLLNLGILASLMVLTGDMLLGWGVSDPSVTELPAMFTRYLSVSDGRIFASALMRLIGDYGPTNALATGWISIGNLWMMCGLLMMAKKVSE